MADMRVREKGFVTRGREARVGGVGRRGVDRSLQAVFMGPVGRRSRGVGGSAFAGHLTCGSIR
jgi:hypothetical protein